MIAVAVGHYWGGAATSHPNPVRLAVYPWHVPLFFFLTGYFWTFGRTFTSEVATRAKSLLLPFAAWTLIFGIPIYGYAAYRGADVLPQVVGTLRGGGATVGVFEPYWFLPVLFAAAVLTRALERAPRWVSWAAAVAGLVACYFAGRPLSFVPHDVFFAFPCLLFVLAGQELARHQDQIPHKALLAVVALLISFTAVFTGIAAPLDIKPGNFGTPVLSVVFAILICGSLTVLFRTVFDGHGARVQPFVSKMAQVLVVVLLTHTFFFAGVPHLELRTIELPPIGTFLVSLIGAWALGFALHRTPLSRVLTGVPRLKRTR